MVSGEAEFLGIGSEEEGKLPTSWNAAQQKEGRKAHEKQIIKSSFISN